MSKNQNAFCTTGVHGSVQNQGALLAFVVLHVGNLTFSMSSGEDSAQSENNNVHVCWDAALFGKRHFLNLLKRRSNAWIGRSGLLCCSLNQQHQHLLLDFDFFSRVFLDLQLEAWILPQSGGFVCLQDGLDNLEALTLFNLRLTIMQQDCRSLRVLGDDHHLFLDYPNDDDIKQSAGISFHQSFQCHDAWENAIQDPNISGKSYIPHKMYGSTARQNKAIFLKR